MNNKIEKTCVECNTQFKVSNKYRTITRCYQCYAKSKKKVVKDTYNNNICHVIDED